MVCGMETTIFTSWNFRGVFETMLGQGGMRPSELNVRVNILGIIIWLAKKRIFDRWSHLLDMAGTMPLFIRKCWFATTERFLRNILVSIKILRNLSQLQDGLSSRRNYALLQNSKLSPFPVNLKTRMDQKSNPYMLMVKAAFPSWLPSLPVFFTFSRGAFWQISF